MAEPFPTERLTQHARRAVALATELAKTYQHAGLAAAHLLYGLLAEGSGVAATVLRELGLTAQSVYKPIGDLFTVPPLKPKELPTCSPEWLEVMTKARAVADEYQHDYIGTEHLLLALISGPDNSVWRVLAWSLTTPVADFVLKARDRVRELLEPVSPPIDKKRVVDELVRIRREMRKTVGVIDCLIAVCADEPAEDWPDGSIPDNLKSRSKS